MVVIEAAEPEDAVAAACEAAEEALGAAVYIAAEDLLGMAT